MRYRPPDWRDKGRPDHLEIPAGIRVPFVEGVGASRRELTDLLDAAISGQSDFGQAERRGVERAIVRNGLDPANAKRGVTSGSGV